MLNGVSDSSLGKFVREFIPSLTRVVSSYVSGSDERTKILQALVADFREHWHREFQPEEQTVVVPGQAANLVKEKAELIARIGETVTRSNEKLLAGFAANNQQELKQYFATHDNAFNLMIANSTKPGITINCLKILAQEPLRIYPTRQQALEMSNSLDQRIKELNSSRQTNQAEGLELELINVIPSLEDLKAFIDRHFVNGSGDELGQVRQFGDKALTTAPVINDQDVLLPAINTLRSYYSSDSRPEFADLKNILERIIAAVTKSNASLFNSDTIQADSNWVELDLQKLILSEELKHGQFLRYLLGRFVLKPTGLYYSNDLIKLKEEPEHIRQKALVDQLKTILSLFSALNKKLLAEGGQGFLNQAFINKLADLARTKHKSNFLANLLKQQLSA